MTRDQTAPPARVVAVDLARAVALVGMFAAHLVSPSDPNGVGGVDNLFQLVAGRSSALFALLAGVGIALSTTRAAADPWGHRGRLAVRAGVVAALGLALGSFDSGLAIILTYYGVLFLCALPVLTWGARPLAVLATGWALLAPVASMLLRRQVEAPPKIVPSFVHLADPGTLLTELLLTGYYPVLTWGAYLFAGMAVGRLDLRRPAVGPRLALVGAGLAALSVAVSTLVTSSPSVRAALLADPRRPVTDWAGLDGQIRRGLFGTHPTGTPWWLGVWAPHSGSIVDLVHTTGTAILVLGLALWLVRSTAALPWRVAAGAGAMTLTLYATHAVVLASPLGARGTAALVLHTLLALSVGALFASAPARGPLEQMVSSVAGVVPVRDDRPSRS
ncbi:heparan-alpha-glucosaminide N-acetyltransferase domain-containing protein [Ornithinimicrobium pekingense]|uniref:Transporter n=1 Tax=Ornithinimicrobium pekingense TaxID=384677 RepID=A0ABQ2F6G9_9MICO|nr:heparan-alpha-glucosaminide N-acetyltransferase domain-containing protein [Ornithinimicrobium pekingense]GGK66774.1 transporter [Ornithinimicrobium pekingense]